MNLIERKLIQNYFEVNGSFDKIAATEVGKLLEGTTDITESCFRLLGYEPHEGFTAKECHGIRVAIKKGDLSYLAAVLGVVSLEEAVDAAVASGILAERPADAKPMFRYNKTLAKYSTVLAEYFRIANEPVKFRTIVDLKYAVHSLKLEPSKLTKNVKDICDNNPGMVSFQNDGGELYVYKKIFHVDKDFSEKEQRTIILDALKFATGLSLDISPELLGKPHQLLALPFTNAEQYIDLLEKAEVNGCTYAEFMERFGIHVADYASAYFALGIIPVIVGDHVFLFTKESTEEVPIFRTSLADFRILCSKMLVRG